MNEYARDPGRVFSVRLRCRNDDCGWQGECPAVTQYGTTTYELDSCPECGAELEESTL